MSLTNDQLLERILAIEATINDMQTAVNSLATKQQLKQFVFLRHQQAAEVETRVTDLETAIALLQSS